MPFVLQHLLLLVGSALVMVSGTELPPNVMHGDTYLYTDLSSVNTTDSLALIMKTDLVRFEFAHDSVGGRKQLGVLPKDAMRLYPEAVEVVESYTIPNKDRKKPPLVLSNFPVVDKNGIFMHGIAALQELVHRQGHVYNKLQDLQSNLAGRKALFEDIEKRLSISASEKQQQRKALAEAALLNEKKRSDIEAARLVDDVAVITQSLQDERIVLERQEKLLADRQRAEEEKERALYESTARLERELNAVALAQQEVNAGDLIAWQTQLDKDTDARKLQMEQEKIRAETESRIAQERASEDVTIRRLQTQAKLDADKWKAVVLSIVEQIRAMGEALVSNPTQLAILVGAVLGTILLYYLARESISLLRQFLQAQLGKPNLVRETSYHWSPFSSGSWLSNIFGRRETVSIGASHIQKSFEKVVLGEAVQSRVNQLALSTRNSKASGAPYRHLLLHGPPGTGKTLIARTLAASSGLDYAIMSGGDVGPLGEDAVNQLHRLFQWAGKSKKGLMLFIDEAEAFLNARAHSGGEDSIHRRHALNALLYQTGSQSHSFMLVLATNRPEDLDSAVLDRMDASVLVDIPGPVERARLVRLYMQEHCITPAEAINVGWKRFVPFLRSSGDQCFVDKKCYTDELLSEITAQTTGFSGREIAKLFIAARHAMLLDENRTLSVNVLRDVVSTKVTEHVQKAGFDGNSTIVSSSSSSSKGGGVVSVSAPSALSGKVVMLSKDRDKNKDKDKDVDGTDFDKGNGSGHDNSFASASDSTFVSATPSASTSSSTEMRSQGQGHGHGQSKGQKGKK